MVVALFACAAALGCASQQRAIEKQDSTDLNTVELATGRMPTVEVSAERPAGLVPEVETVASRSGQGGVYADALHSLNVN
jgi:hypothetical protein